MRTLLRCFREVSIQKRGSIVHSMFLSSQTVPSHCWLLLHSSASTVGDIWLAPTTNGMGFPTRFPNMIALDITSRKKHGKVALEKYHTLCTYVHRMLHVVLKTIHVHVQCSYTLCCKCRVWYDFTSTNSGTLRLRTPLKWGHVIKFRTLSTVPAKYRRVHVQNFPL